MTAAVRPLSNLVIPEHLMMPGKLQSARFMYVYAQKYKGPPSAFMTRLWAAVLFPTLAANSAWGTGGAKAADTLRKAIPAGFLRIKKEADHFVVNVPLFQFAAHNVSNVQQFLTQYMLGGHRAKGKAFEPTAQHVADMTEFAESLQAARAPDGSITNMKIPAARVLAASAIRLDAKAQDALKECLLGIRVQLKGNFAMIFADFKIEKDEAQQLTTTEWNQLRDIDLYPLLMHWVNTVFGEKGNVAIASFPISKIVNTLPKNHTEAARVNEYGLSIGATGAPHYLPLEVDKNQTRIYEDRYTQAGLREDGSFCLVNTDEGAQAMSSGSEVKTKLPPNMVVAVDWVNNKFSYTNTSGNLEVVDLSNTRKPDAAHIRTLLFERIITVEMMDWFARMGEAAGVSNKVDLGADDLEGLNISGTLLHTFQSGSSLQAYYKAATVAWKGLEEQDVVHLNDVSVHGFGPFRAIARQIKIIEAAIKSNLEAVYLKWSVASVTDMLPWLTLIAKYTDDLPALQAADKTARAAAITAKDVGPDPKWEVPSIPLMSDKIGFLPHQRKVRNLLRDSPDFALLPVQAGGGKSILLLTDVLLEIKANRNEPYLVLCPGHLVANYVKEVVDFTSGKMNVIALTNVAIRQSGIKRLQSIMEAAPRNTVVVCDYDTLKYSPRGTQRAVTYGTKTIQTFPVVDWLRQFNFGYVALDESHKVKNDNSRTRSVRALITDIPKKRLASGTMVHDSPSDLAMQVAMFDPTLFGTRDEFNEKYGANVRGGRVVEWRKGAQQEIMDKIKSRIVYAGAMRKEWAALLPQKQEWVGGVELTPRQQEEYEKLLDGVAKKIEEKAKGGGAKAKALQKFLKGKAVVPDKDAALQTEDTSDETDDEVEDVADENAGQDIEAAIQPHLAILERFLIAPTSVVGDTLTGDDAISPKTLRIINRIKCHVLGGTDDPGDGSTGPYGPFPGKVLIFTNNIKSAEEIYRLAPPELRKSGILYKAERKLEDGARFEKDDKVRWMVGVEQSMNEGLNFQFAARLIRTETPWNPGTLEQGNSRINRPELKKQETRNKIFFDTVVCNKTIDITKTARLISKVIAAAKFENASNAEYATIPDVEAITMTLDAVREKNNWHSYGDNPGLEDYLAAQRKFTSVVRQDYKEYLEAYIAKYGSKPALEPIEVAPTPKDAALLKRVPYTPGLGIYSAKEMGLVRLDEYLNISFDDDDDDEGGDDESDEDEGGELSQGPDPEMIEKMKNLKGHLVHTEHGDGYIVEMQTKGKLVTVDLVNGYSVRARKSQVFLVTRTETSTKDIRNQLLKSVGDLPIAKQVDVPAVWLKAPKGVLKKLQETEKKQQDKEAKERQKKVEAELAIELQFVVTNGFFGLDYVIDEENLTAQQTLTGCGFRPQAPFYYSKVKNVVALRNQMTLWKNSGLSVDPLLYKQGVPQAFREMDALLQSGKIKNHQLTAKQMAGAGLVNFYRLEHKANNDKKVFKPYPIIEGGVAYIALPAQGQAGTKVAMQHKRPAFSWHLSTPSLSFYGTPLSVNKMLAKIVAAGVQITNIKELEKEFHALKTMKLRKDDGTI